MKINNIIRPPDYGKHIIFLGSTGSGKSFLAKRLLRYYEKYFVFDMQENFDIKDNAVRYYKKPSDVINAIKRYVHKIVYQPNMEYHEIDINNYIIKTIVESSKPKKIKERILYIDEIYHLGYQNSFPSYLARGFALARQKKISLWVATQRPKNIPTNVLTEASRIYIFSLSKLDDIKYISEFAPAGREKELQEVIRNLKREEYKFIELDLINKEMYLHDKLI